MSGKLAALILLSSGVVLAALLLLKVVPPIVAGAVFAVDLVALGVLSGGFRRR